MVQTVWLPVHLLVAGLPGTGSSPVGLVLRVLQDKQQPSVSLCLLNFFLLLLCKQCIKDNLSQGGKSGSQWLIFWYRAYPWLPSGWVLSEGALVSLSYCSVLVLGSILASWFTPCKGYMDCLQAEKLSSTCSGVPQALPLQITLLGAPWGNQAPLQCHRCLQCSRGHCRARDCHLALTSLRCLYSCYGHMYSSPVYSELQAQPQGLPYRQSGRAAAATLLHFREAQGAARAQSSHVCMSKSTQEGSPKGKTTFLFTIHLCHLFCQWSNSQLCSGSLPKLP